MRLLRPRRVSSSPLAGVRGAFQADLELFGADARGTSLGSAVITGEIGGTWTLAARANLIRAGATADTWRLNAAADVINITVIGELAGDLEICKGKVANIGVAEQTAAGWNRCSGYTSGADQAVPKWLMSSLSNSC